MPRTPSTPSSSQVPLIDLVREHKVSDADLKKWAENYKRDSTKALAELLSFLVEASGCDVKITYDEVYDGDIDATVKRVVNDTINGQATVEDPFTTKKKEYKNFKQYFLEFWDKLVREAQDNETLINDDPFEQLISYIEKFSQASIRSCRYAASICALQLVSTFIRVANQLREARDTTQRQLQAEEKNKQKNKADNSRAHSLRRSLETLHRRVNTLESLMKQVFNGVFVHRYRDIDENVRVECISAVGHWCKTYPSYFLKDTYLKYIGWSLNDKESAVRSAALTALQTLYDVEDNHAPMDTFTARFSERVCQMVEDVDNAVAIKSLGTLTKMVKNELIDAEMVKQTYSLLLDDSPQLRQGAAELVNVLLTIKSQATMASHGTKSSEKGLVELFFLLQEFPDNPNYINYMVDALYEKSEVLKDWRCIIQLLLSDDDVLTDMYQLNTIRVLKACIVKTSGEKLVQGIATNKKDLTKQQREAVATFKQELTVHLMKSLPLLIRKHQADPVKSAELMELIPHLKLEVYALKRQEKAFVMLLKQVRDTFFRFSADAALRSCCSSLIHCTGPSTHESARPAAATVVAEVRQESVSRLKKVVAHALTLVANHDVMSAEEDYETLAALKRCYFLQHLGVELNDAKLHVLLAPLLDAVIDGWECSGMIVAAALKVQFEGLLWMLKQLNVQSPDEDVLQDIVYSRNDLMQKLVAMYNSQKDKDLRNEIYNLMADFFVIFSSEKVRGTKLEPVGFSPPMSALQCFWRHCESKLTMPSEEEEGPNEDVENDMLITVCHVSRLVAFDLVPAHRWLAAELVSHFTQHGKKVAEVIKKMLFKLKKVAPETLWEVYLGGMKKAFERYLENGQQSFHLAQFRELAHKISQVYSGFLISDRPNAAKIVRGGVEYAVTNAPRRLPFLVQGLIHFTAKISSGDVSTIVKYFDTIKPPVMDDDLWVPFYNYADHLREKVHLPPLKRMQTPASTPRPVVTRAPAAASLHQMQSRHQQARMQHQDQQEHHLQDEEDDEVGKDDEVDEDDDEEEHRQRQQDMERERQRQIAHAQQQQQQQQQQQHEAPTNGDFDYI